MANRLLEGQKWLNERMGKFASVDIIYHTKVDEWSLIQGVWQGRTAFRVSDQINTRLIWNEADFLIPVNLLIVNGNLIQPKKNHYIYIAYPIPDVDMWFEIAAPDGEQEWRFSDETRTRYRVHTKGKNNPY
jgi:hypothetical protein